jgi:hypothetical protein
VTPISSPAPLQLRRDGDAIVATYDVKDLGAVKGAVLFDASGSASLSAAVVDTAPEGRGVATATTTASEEHIFTR